MHLRLLVFGLNIPTISFSYFGMLSLEDGTVVEIFEWASLEKAKQAHDHPAVAPGCYSVFQQTEYPCVQFWHSGRHLRQLSCFASEYFW